LTKWGARRIDMKIEDGQEDDKRIEDRIGVIIYRGQTK